MAHSSEQHGAQHCAVILAAGVGSRLMPLTAERPKALVEVAGRPLLARLLESCAAAGLCRAVVVVGHHAEVLRRWLGETELPLPVETVFNAEFATINNAHSLLKAREAVRDAGFVKFDGDLVLDPAIVERLLRCEWPCALALDRGVILDDEAMKARVDGEGRVLAMGKWLGTAEAAGESIGVEKIAADWATELFEAIERHVHGEGHADWYYEDVYHRLLPGGWPLGACDIAGLRWCEVDDHADLARAAAGVSGR